MSAVRLSVVQQVHHQEAPTGGAVHVSCPPLQAGNRMKQPLWPVRPDPAPYPARPSKQHPCVLPGRFGNGERGRTTRHRVDTHTMNADEQA